MPVLANKKFLQSFVGFFVPHDSLKCTTSLHIPSLRGKTNKREQQAPSVWSVFSSYFYSENLAGKLNSNLKLIELLISFSHFIICFELNESEKWIIDKFVQSNQIFFTYFCILY